jgi:hypothetical protein
MVVTSRGLFRDGSIALPPPNLMAFTCTSELRGNYTPIGWCLPIAWLSALARCTAGAYAHAMERGVVVRGRLRGRHIELEEDVGELDGEVEVFLRAAVSTPRPPDVLEVIGGLPVGTRTKDDIDRQVADDRAGWTQRG